MDQEKVQETKNSDAQDPMSGGKKGRIIIRNLVFDVKEQHIKKLFNKFGEILDINIPKNPSNNLSKGFAFVEFKNKNNAQNAINTLNRTKFQGREIILDCAVGKDWYMKKRQNNQTNTSEENDIDIIENEIKEDKIEEETHVEKPVQQSNHDQQKQKQSKKKQAEDLSQTLFVRNLPLDANDEQLKEFFLKFGDVTMAKVVMNKESGGSRGTGFIKFREWNTANELLQKSAELERLHRQGRYKQNNQLSQDEQELLNGELDFDGRRIFVFEAVKRDAVGEFQNKSQQQAVKPTKDISRVKSLKKLIPYDPNDKRNLKQALLGIFEPEDDMNPKEYKRREDHVRVKLQRLKNPNFFVSDRRVAIKNLPKSQDLEQELQCLVAEAMRWGNVVSNDKFRILEKIWISRDKNIQAADSNAEAPITGLAFLEFREAQNAQVFMRYVMENRGNVIKQLHNRLPLIEFAIEDARKLRRIELRRENQKERQQAYHQQKLQQNGGKETRTQKKNRVNSVNKVAIDNILKQTDCDSEENIIRIKLLWTDLKSRGMKQRLKKKVESLVKNISLDISANKVEAVETISKLNGVVGNIKKKKQIKSESKFNQKQQVQEVEASTDKQEKISKKDSKLLEDHFEGLMHNIKAQVLERKKKKQQKLEEDEVDQMAEKRLKQLTKKVKWFA